MAGAATAHGRNPGWPPGMVQQQQQQTPGASQRPWQQGAHGQGQGGSMPSPALPSGHVVAVELVSTKDEVPVAVLELEVVPRPIIIDRTFRYGLMPSGLGWEWEWISSWRAPSGAA